MNPKAKGATDRELATPSPVHESGGNGKVAHLSVAERAARGKAARAEVPRNRARRVVGAVGSP